MSRDDAVEVFFVEEFHKHRFFMFFFSDMMCEI